MRILASVLTVWAAFRWAGLIAGIVRLRRFPKGPVRREARRSCVARWSWNVAWTVVAFFAWVQALDLRPRAETTGFASMLVLFSLVAGVAAFFMQPQERTPETLDIFRLRRKGRRPEPAVPEAEPTGTEG